MTTRALRRHHYHRLKGRYRKIIKSWYHSRPLTEEEIDRQAAFMANTAHRCSCPICGNRRKYSGPTLQERRISQ